VQRATEEAFNAVSRAGLTNAGAAVIFLLIGLVLYSDISKMSFVQRLLQ